VGGLGAVVGTLDDTVGAEAVEGAAREVSGALGVESTLDLSESRQAHAMKS
jgi:hypothetical protein